MQRNIENTVMIEVKCLEITLISINHPQINWFGFFV